ncbi:MAG: hypothetical protein WA277_00405 [Nitrospirota bacterium]
MNKTEMKKYGLIWVLTSFFIGTILGSGAIWQWQQLKVSKERFSFEKQNALRKEREDKLRNIFTLNENLRKAKSEVQKKAKESLNLLLLQLTNSINDFNKIEGELAELEKRAPLILKVESDLPKSGIVLDHLAPAAPM